MQVNQKFCLTLLGIFGFLGLAYGDEAMAVEPMKTVETVPMDGKSTIPALAESPMVANAPMSPAITPVSPAITPVSPAISPMAAVDHPGLQPIPATGEAVTTETRTPDGSIITVTKYNGQFPQHFLPPQYSSPNAFWSPIPQFGHLYGNQGLYRPYFVNNPL